MSQKNIMVLKLNLYLQSMVLTKYIHIPYLIISYYKFLTFKKLVGPLLTAMAWSSYLHRPGAKKQHNLIIHFLFLRFTKQLTNIYWSNKQRQWAQIASFDPFNLRYFCQLRDSYFLRSGIQFYYPAKNWNYITPRHLNTAPDWLTLIDIDWLPDAFLDFFELDGKSFYKFNFKLYFRNFDNDGPKHFTKVFSFRLLHYPILYKKTNSKLFIRLQQIPFDIFFDWKELANRNSILDAFNKRQTAIHNLIKYFVSIGSRERVFVEFVIYYRLKELLLLSKTAEARWCIENWYTKSIDRYSYIITEQRHIKNMR